MKVFEFKHPDGEREWVSAMTAIGAVHVYVNHHDCILYDIVDLELEEVDRQTQESITVGGVSLRSMVGNEEDYITGTMYG